jgi:LytS/YehU family sensor histidine kinase
LLDFVRTLSAALIIDVLVATACILIRISTTTQRELREERELKHRTEYQYERLKQQINPHFLFNSLGILDYLVQEEETERASAFIHKFADIYRYMLNTDQKSLIKLSDELDFTMKYIDLLKERFIEGMIFEIDIEPQLLNFMVVPCSMQLLVENATKHNIVSGDMPLKVSITTEGDYLVVRNNLQPRTHGQPSTKLGLANIRQQYIDVANRDIIIEKSDSEFIVKLPIV